MARKTKAVIKSQKAYLKPERARAYPPKAPSVKDMMTVAATTMPELIAACQNSCSTQAP